MNCPDCDAQIDIEADDVDEGDLVSCDECGAELRVVSTEPLELESADEDEDEEEEDGFLDEDEEEEEPEDEWK